MTDVAKKTWGAPLRNAAPILEVLQDVLPTRAVVLEIASGTGQHAAYFSTHSQWQWQPSDPDPEARSSIMAWREDAPSNLRAPLDLDVLVPWPHLNIEAIACINMIHISPWEATEALFRGAQEHLSQGQPLFTYGPYTIEGQHTSESNARFHNSLRERNEAWGVRDIAELEAVASQHGLELERRVQMPANNFSLIFRRR